MLLKYAVSFANAFQRLETKGVLGWLKGRGREKGGPVSRPVSPHEDGTQGKKQEKQEHSLAPGPPVHHHTYCLGTVHFDAIHKFQPFHLVALKAQTLKDREQSK